MIGLWAFATSSAGQGLIQNVIAALALVLAVLGVRTWRQERRDLRRAELAETALATAYKAMDALSMVRSPFGWESEGSTRKQVSNELATLSDALDQAFVPIERLNKVTDIFDEIQSLRYSITAAFGKTYAEPLVEFLNVRIEITNAAQSQMRDVAERRLEERLTPFSKSEAQVERDIKRGDDRDAITWEGLPGDRITARLQKSVADLESNFRPFVEAKFRPIGILARSRKGRHSS